MLHYLVRLRGDGKPESAIAFSETNEWFDAIAKFAEFYAMYSCHNDPHEAILLKTRTPATTFDIIAKLRDIVKPTFRMDVVPLNQEVFDDELSGFHQQLPLRCATNPPDVIAVALRPGRRFGRGGGRAPGLMELRNRREFGDLQEYIHNKGFTQIPIPEPIVEEVTENIVAR